MPVHYPVILQTFPFTLKDNAMKCEIKNIGKTPVKDQYGKILHVNTLCPIFYFHFIVN